MTWTAIEDALVARCRAALSLADGQVVLSDQDGARRARPSLNIVIGDCIPLGVDEKRSAFDAGGAAGQELVTTITGDREFPVTIEAFSAATTGEDTAGRMLARVGLELSAPDTVAAFHAAGFTVPVVGEVLHLAAILRTKNESRATMSLRCYTRLELVKRGGYVTSGAVVLNSEHTIAFG